MGRFLRTLSTVSIHKIGQGLKGGLAEIAQIGKFIAERGSNDELLASEVPEELKVCLICDIVDAFPSRGQWEDTV